MLINGLAQARINGWSVNSAVARYPSRLGQAAERLDRLLRAEAGRTALELVHVRLAREACQRLVHVAAPISQLAFELSF